MDNRELDLLYAFRQGEKFTQRKHFIVGVVVGLVIAAVLQMHFGLIPHV